MPEATPSRKKFRVAKLFADGLQKIYGPKLKAVFVTGSVAANVAKPDSDIDLIVVYSRGEPRKGMSREELEKLVEEDWKREGSPSVLKKSFALRHGSTVNYFLLEDKIFEKIGRGVVLPIGFKPFVDALHDGAVPIFGARKYLQKHSGRSFAFPSLPSIRDRYRKTLTGKDDIAARLRFKPHRQGRKRFI